MLATTYRMLTDIGSPVIAAYLRRRLKQGKEDRGRFQERRGVPSHPRPHGRLIWCHAASVGEAASFLALIHKLRETYPATQVLITTGTVTSAKMLAGRLPLGVIHQYVPVDRVPYVEAFLDHWKPDLALWIESELWPNTLAEMRARFIPAVLLNGAMSPKSFRGWRRFKGWARELMATFALCIAQTEADLARFVALGAKPVICLGNLKYAGHPLPFDAASLAQIKAAIGKRPVWLMASTHPGEETMALAAHRKLHAVRPDILTVIVPRHARRGDDIAASFALEDVAFARRSQDGLITPDTEIYLADTMGELGLFYRLCPMMVMGGSFVPIGGHNLIEPAQLGCAIITGPDMSSFLEVAAEFKTQGAALQVASADEIATTIGHLLNDPEHRQRLAEAAGRLADRKRGVLDDVINALEPWLGAPEAQMRPNSQMVLT